MTRLPARLAPLLLVATTLPACDVLQTGAENTLAFEFVSSDRLVPLSFSTPLAVGLSVDVKVYLAGENRVPASISLVQPDDQTVARVTSLGASGFTVIGRQAGTTPVSIVSAAGNDAFQLTVATLDKIVLTYPNAVLAPATPPVHVAEGGTAHFGFTLLDASGRTLIGYGALPLTFTPSDRATQVPGTSTGLVALHFESAGDVTITPPNATALDVTVVPASDITSLTLTAGTQDAATAATAINVGAETAVFVDARNDLAERIFGVDGVVTVVSDTPALCEVGHAPLFGDTAWRVTGLDRGTCRVSATLGALVAEAQMEIQ